MRWLLILTTLLALSGCSAFKKKETAQSSGRGAIRTRQDEIENPDINTMMQKEFYMGRNSSISGRSSPTKPAKWHSFLFTERTQTKEFDTRKFGTTKARTEDYPQMNKTAPAGEAPEHKKSFLAKIFSTRKAREADQTVATNTLPAANKPYLKKGRRQAEFDTKGPASDIPSQSWDGDFTELKTVEDIRALLNKN